MTNRYAVVSIGGTLHLVDLLDTPKVLLTTSGGAPIDSLEIYVNGTITITGRDAVATRNMQIRGRGNSTWAAAKKPYKVKLSSAASLVPGVAADRDWVLLACFYDPAYIRTMLATEIANRCAGLEWTPQFRFVEVTLNGVYQGLYLIGEHVKVDSDRIAIDDPDDATSGLALTGGYSMELDQRLETNNEPGFRTTLQNLPIVLDEPDDTVPEQAAYIEEWMNNFETVLFGANWLDPEDGYARFIDQDSWIDWFLVTELAAVHDAQNFSSIKLYKKRDTAEAPGRLFMGPIWDFDNSYGNYFRNPEALGWTARLIPWYWRMFDDPAFAAAVWARWQVIRDSLGDINAYIERKIQIIWPLAERDKVKWNLLASRDAEITGLQTWLAARIDWLNTNLAP